MDETCQAVAWGLGHGDFWDFQGEPENQKGLRMRQIYTGNDRLMGTICPFFFLGGGKGSLLRKICRMIVFVETKSKIA